jgi:hypothetical protein
MYRQTTQFVLATPFGKDQEDADAPDDLPDVSDEGEVAGHQD